MAKAQAPSVEMLWETDEPGGALEARFGFGDAAEASRWVAATLGEHWGIRVEGCERIVMSDRNALAWVGTASGSMLAKWSVAPGRFPRLAALAHLVSWLDEQELPISAPVAALDGRLQVQVDGVSLGLQRKITGHLLETGDLDHVRAAGAALARLHQVLAHYPDTDRIPDLVTPLQPLAARITAWLDSCPEGVPLAACQALGRLVADMPPEPLTVQLVHGDFRSANVLCAGSGVAAVIDFEEARIDSPIVELARSAVLLGTRFHHWGPVSPDVHAGFLDGYQCKRRLSPTEALWWDTLVLWSTLAMVPPGEDPTGWGPAALSHLTYLGQDT